MRQSLKFSQEEFINAVKTNKQGFVAIMNKKKGKDDPAIMYKETENSIPKRFTINVGYPKGIRPHKIEDPDEKKEKDSSTPKYRAVFYVGEDENSLIRAFHDLCIHLNGELEGKLCALTTQVKSKDPKDIKAGRQYVEIPIPARNIKVALWFNYADEAKTIKLINHQITVLSPDENGRMQRNELKKLSVNLEDISNYMTPGCIVYGYIAPSFSFAKETWYLGWKWEGDIIIKQVPQEVGMSLREKDETINMIQLETVQDQQAPGLSPNTNNRATGDGESNELENAISTINAASNEEN